MVNKSSVIFELGEAHDLPRHAHAGYELFLLLKGMVFFELDGTSCLMHPGDIIVCGSGQVRGAKGNGRNILFRLEIGKEFLSRECGDQHPRLVCNSTADTATKQLREYSELRRILFSLMIAHFERGDALPLKMKSELLRLLSLLFEHFSAEERPQSTGNGNGRVEGILAHIRRNYREELSLQSLAAKEGLSVHHLSRLFTKQTGKSFTEHVNEIRLAGAVYDLIHTGDAISRIALNNGFSTSGSFTQLFRRQYGETPARYRALRKITQKAPDEGAELAHTFEGRSDIIKYLRQFDTKNQAKTDPIVHAAADTAVAGGEFLRLPVKIIRAGNAHQLLKAEVQEELAELLNAMPIDHVHFACGLDDGMYPYKDAMYSHYEYFALFDYLQTSGVSPFLQIRAHSVVEAMRDGYPDALVNRLSELLTAIRERYSPEFLRRWRFEIACPDECEPHLAWSCYQVLWERIRGILPDACIGLRFKDSGGPLDDRAAALQSILRLCRAHDGMPQFITYYIAQQKHRELLEDKDYARYRHAVSNRIRLFYDAMAEAVPDMPDIMLMQWNTLSGYTTAESNIFYRSALFLDELLHLDRRVKGVAFWINTYVYEEATGKNHFNSVALFLFKRLKRPLFFSLCLLEGVFSEIVLREDSLFVTRNTAGDLAILAFNPCYFNPRHALDPDVLNRERRVFSLRLDNIHGPLLFERYHMDNRQTALYDRWAHMGFPAIVNANVMEQLGKTLSMDYSAYEDVADGRYVLTLPLEFNEASIVIVRRKQTRAA